MSKGVYERTEKHIDQCRKAGRASAKSIENIERYKSRNTLVVCLQCKNQFYYPISQKRKFCNKNCFDKYQTNDNPKTYGSLHAWVRRSFGTPSECEHCHTTESKKFEWANISHKYLMDRSDWARLCCQCHRRYDLGNKKRIEVLNV